jgi:hypothetical protein
VCVALMKVRATSLRPYILWPNASSPRPLDVHCLNDNRPHLALPPAQSSYSLTIARRVLSLAAWRLGRIAAATPARAASSTTITRLSTGRLTTVIPWFFMASTSAQPKNIPDQQAEDRPLQGDDHRLPPDRRPQLWPGHPHRAHDAEFAVRSKIDSAGVLPCRAWL